VPEYDAFGREIGEDTLAGWRTGSGAQPPQPAPAPQQAAPQQAAPQQAPAQQAAPVAVTSGDPLGGTAAAPPPVIPQTRRERKQSFGGLGAPRKRRRGIRLVVLLIVAWVTFNVISGIAGKVDEVARTITIPNLSPPAAAKPPVGLEQGSLLRPAKFREAIAQIRRRGGGKLQNLRVAPERIDATLISDRGTLINVQVSATEGYRRFSESGPGFTATGTVPFGKLDARIPRKVTRAGAERLGAPVDQINYLVPSLSDGKVVWGAYFKNGSIFLADARGRITRRIS
jgi:hypothetical protein